jgi:hypothetical protein
MQDDKYQAQYLKANVDTSVKTRREMFEDVEHLVVPVIAAKQMVMNGLFYPAEEFRDWVETWNGVPVPVSHPEINGVAVSARSPRIQELTSVGSFFNVEFTEDNKLKGEIWLNIQKAKKLNYEYLVDKFENGEIIEVSTGLFSNLEMVSGEYDGVKYNGVVRHIRPDHLALLPNEVGACSIEDGCGTMRNNCKECNGKCNETKTTREKINKALRLVGERLGLIGNKESFDEIRKKVNIALEDKTGSFVFVLDIYDDMVVYVMENEGKDAFYKVSYVMADGKVMLGDDTQEVVRKTTYSPVISDNKQKNNGGNNNMDKSKLIQDVIANSANSFTESDKETLDGLSEDVLSKMAVNEEATEEVVEQEESGEEITEETTEETVKDNEETTEEVVESSETTEQKVNSLLDGIEDAEVKEFLGNAITEHKSKKEALINGIISNSTFTQEELKEMSFNHIQKLAESCKKQSFNGRGTTFNQPKTNGDYKVPSIFDVKETK